MTNLPIVKPERKNKIRIHMVGKKFGRLTVIEEVYCNKHRRYLKCLCECGNIKIVPMSHLRNGHTKSCGCLKREKAIKHAMWGTPEYITWHSMMQRCYNPNNNAYKDYGGRGIFVSEKWHNFETFLADMGLKPKGLTIDRINNDREYSKDNCSWTTYVEQVRNRRLNKTNKTGVAGVRWRKDIKKYHASIWLNYKIYNLGHFKTLEKAIAARKAGEVKFWAK